MRLASLTHTWLLTVVVLGTLSPTFAAEGWHTDFEAAR